MKSIAPVLFSLPLALIACGGDDGVSVIDGGEPDAETGGPDACVSKPLNANGTAIGRGDRLHLDEMGPVEGGACGATATYGAAVIGMSAGFGEVEDVCVANSPTAFIGYQGTLNTDATPDVLALELYAGFGVFANGITTGTFTLSGDELQYADCGVCVLILADVSTQGAPGSLYMATGGTVNITQVSPNITGTLSNVTFTHVQIDDQANSTPDPDGCPSAITSASFDALVEFE